MNRVVVITGASSGVGRAAAVAIAARGDAVAVVGRDPERTNAVAARTGADAFLADFNRLDDVRELAAALLTRYDRIDVLMNNAGALFSERMRTPDGHERTFQTNVLSPFLLTELLLPRLIATAADATVPRGTVRVLATASSANRFATLHLDDLDWMQRPFRHGWPVYNASKLAVIMWIRELAERLTGTDVDAFSVHPGTVGTGWGGTSRLVRLGNTLVPEGFRGRSPESGAAPLVALAGIEREAAPSGTYFSRFRPGGAVAAQATDAQLCRDLFTRLAALAGIAATAGPDAEITTSEGDGNAG